MDYIFHGTKVKASELERFLLHMMEVNLAAELRGERKTPICIWGKHGIGKTEIVESLAATQKYKLAYLAPAQFEEMGDLIGMPVVEGLQTSFRPPDWVPREEGPGILLIDDINRADDRILRGLMQLLQFYALQSWELPSKWQIICTANPDGGDYSVTPMDDAMLTRMMHVSLDFDVQEWGTWAEKKAIDPRGINFILTYPELVNGQKTTARTLVQFFNAIALISNLKENLGLIQILGDSCLDEATVSAFIAFVNQNLERLPSPQKILNASNFEQEIKLHLKTLVQGAIIRVDILATLCTRIANYLRFNSKVSPIQLNNIKQFLKMELLPNDLRHALLHDLMKLANSNLKGLLADPEIGQLYLNEV